MLGIFGTDLSNPRNQATFGIYYFWTENISSSEEYTGKQLTFRYSGLVGDITPFTVNQIAFYDDDLGWYYLAHSFCIPSNHWRWATDTGTVECINDTLSIHTTSATFYINYSESQECHNGSCPMSATVSPAKVTDLTLITLDPMGDDVSVQLHWDRSVYQCISTKNSALSAAGHYECTDEISSDCSQIAFAVGISQTAGNLIQIKSLNVTDEDGITFSMTQTLCFDGSHIVVDLTTIDGWTNLTNKVLVYNTSEYQDGTCFNTQGI